MRKFAFMMACAATMWSSRIILTRITKRRPTKNLIWNWISNNDVKVNDKLKSTMLHHRKKLLPKNPISSDETNSYLQNALVLSILTENQAWLTHEHVIRDDYSYLMFGAKKILDRLPHDRHFNVTSTERVVPAGHFKVLMTFSLVANTMVSKDVEHSIDCLWQLPTPSLRIKTLSMNRTSSVKISTDSAFSFKNSKAFRAFSTGTADKHKNLWNSKHTSSSVYERS